MPIIWRNRPDALLSGRHRDCGAVRSGLCALEAGLAGGVGAGGVSGGCDGAECVRHHLCNQRRRTDLFLYPLHHLRPGGSERRGGRADGGRRLYPGSGHHHRPAGSHRYPYIPRKKPDRRFPGRNGPAAAETAGHRLTGKRCALLSPSDCAAAGHGAADRPGGKS